MQNPTLGSVVPLGMFFLGSLRKAFQIYICATSRFIMSLGMYDLKPVFDLDAKVDIPDCMYR